MPSARSRLPAGARCAARSALALLAILTVTGCGASGGASGGPARPSGTGPAIERDLRNISFDPAPLYRQMGMIARGIPFPVVGRVGYLASDTPDTTHVTLALSFSATSLSFQREADNRFRANYTFGISVNRAGERVTNIEGTESVIVGSYRETGRSDESILFQEILDLAPGRYTLTIALRDVASQRGFEETVEMTVPVYRGRALSTPIPVLQVRPRTTRDSLPLVLLSPRSTAVIGRDSVLPLYLEGYGGDATALRLLARNESGRVLWSDAVSLKEQSDLTSGVIEVPVARLGIGVSQLSFVRESGGDTTSTFVFVGFGEDLPVARFDDMLQFLRHFATPARLQALRDAPEEERPAAWAKFMAETDSTPNTAVHEDLRAYFARLVRANNRFREEGVPGWMSDRGKVSIVLGDPDQILEPQFTDYQRNRQQLWEYRGLGLQLVFFDQTGTGRWRLTQSSEVRFETEYRRRLR